MSNCLTELHTHTQCDTRRCWTQCFTFWIRIKSILIKLVGFFVLYNLKVEMRGTRARAHTHTNCAQSLSIGHVKSNYVEIHWKSFVGTTEKSPCASYGLSENVNCLLFYSFFSTLAQCFSWMTSPIFFSPLDLDDIWKFIPMRCVREKKID